MGDMEHTLTLGTLFAAALAALVAWRMYKSEVMKQRVDLTRERHECFCLLRTYLALRAGAMDKALQVHDDLQSAQDRYYFLFSQRIGNFVVECLEKGSERDAQQYALATASPESHHAASLKATKLDAWFAQEAFGIQRRFNPYLRPVRQKLELQ